MKNHGFHAELGIFGFSRERTVYLLLTELSYCFAGLSDKIGEQVGQENTQPVVARSEIGRAHV